MWEFPGLACQWVFFVRMVIILGTGLYPNVKCLEGDTFLGRRENLITCRHTGLLTVKETFFTVLPLKSVNGYSCEFLIKKVVQPSCVRRSHQNFRFAFYAQDFQHEHTSNSLAIPDHRKKIMCTLFFSACCSRTISTEQHVYHTKFRFPRLYDANVSNRSGTLWYLISRVVGWYLVIFSCCQKRIGEARHMADKKCFRATTVKKQLWVMRNLGDSLPKNEIKSPVTLRLFSW